MTYNTFKKKYRPASWKILCAVLLGTTSAFAAQCPILTEVDVYNEIMIDQDGGITSDNITRALHPYEDPAGGVVPGHTTWKISDRMYRTSVANGHSPDIPRMAGGARIIDAGNAPDSLVAYVNDNLNNYFRGIAGIGVGGGGGVAAQPLTLDHLHAGNNSVPVTPALKAAGQSFGHSHPAAQGTHGCRYTYNFTRTQSKEIAQKDASDAALAAAEAQAVARVAAGDGPGAAALRAGAAAAAAAAGNAAYAATALDAYHWDIFLYDPTPAPIVPALAMPAGMDAGLYNAIRVIPVFAALPILDGNRVLVAIHDAITAHPAHGAARTGDIRARLGALGIGAVDAAFQQLMIDEVDHAHPHVHVLAMPAGMDVGLYNAIRVIPVFAALPILDGNRVLVAIHDAITAHPAHGAARTGGIRARLGALGIGAVDAAFEQLMIDEVDHAHPHVHVHVLAKPAAMDVGLYNAIRVLGAFTALPIAQQNQVLVAIDGAIAHVPAHGAARDAEVRNRLGLLGIAAIDAAFQQLMIDEVDHAHPHVHVLAMPAGMDAGLYNAIRVIPVFAALPILDGNRVLVAIHDAITAHPAHGAARTGDIRARLGALGIGAVDAAFEQLMIDEVDHAHPHAHPHVHVHVLAKPAAMDVGLYNAIRVLGAFTALPIAQQNQVFVAIDGAIAHVPAHGAARDAEVRNRLGLLGIAAIDAAFQQLMIDEVDRAHPIILNAQQQQIHLAHPHVAPADIAALPAPLAQYAADHGLAPVPGIAAPGREPAVADLNLPGVEYRIDGGQLLRFRGGRRLGPVR